MIRENWLPYYFRVYILFILSNENCVGDFVGKLKDNIARIADSIYMQ